MADRRMLTRKVTDNDNFVALPAAAQALYLHLTMSADDDGFCSQISTAMFRAHAKKKDLEALLNARYLLRFESGVMVLKHWPMANSKRADRYTPTVYQEEYARLQMKPNRSYTMATTWQPDGNQPVPQKKREEKRIEEKNREGLVLHAREEEPEAPEEQNELGKVMTFYLDRINPMPSPMAVDFLKGYTETLGADVVLHAMSIALDERKTGWSYIQAILQRYERDGLNTMDAVLRAEQDHAKAKTEQRQPQKKPSQIYGTGKMSKKSFDRAMADLESMLKEDDKADDAKQ